MKVLAFILALVLAVPAVAGTIHPLGFPEPVTELGERIDDVYTFLFWIVFGVFILVEFGLLFMIWRFRKSRQAKAATFSHNTFIEIVWTVIPSVICLAIAWKSYEVLAYARTMPQKGLQVEAMAYQFGWDFNFPDAEFSTPEADGPDPRLSLPEKERFVKTLVVPVDTNIKVLVSSKDVIHAFYVPKLGAKIDAVPGRINYLWFNAKEEGLYIGQCAELCGSAHGEMFFNVKVVSQDEWLAWANAQRAEESLAPLTKEAFGKLL